ncbi:Gx transporter family protein [candidate division KSB1 bacterium]|nr:Gx transporter family protein [candidate division KSB1 bacterium]
MKAFASKKITWIAVFTTTALLLFLFDSAFPRPLPWLKPGLANAVTLLALYLFDLPTALLIVILRVILGNLLFGTLFSPTMLLSLGGGVAAALVMGLSRFLRPGLFSPVGLSVLGALTHNAVQLALAALLIVRSDHLWALLPWMSFSAVLTGLLVGLSTWLILTRLAASHLLKIDCLKAIDC